ncbi:hypothetical protein [Halorubrum ezzemoulense]|uniref:hypothetical protein n=1 Tax=Halorubrum ezzemoulense TaxID=337243 RepID=UPI00233074A4|nr:hypothetical protein [Halorubrum ezzemoulense]MDB2239333.1 hypothetical protein [Halorubrum ezzemoulense]
MTTTDRGGGDERYNKNEYFTLKQLGTHHHLMVIGKPNTYTTDESKTNVSVDPEALIIVGEPTRERWEAEMAEFTLDQIEAYEDGTAPHFDEVNITMSTTSTSFENTTEPSSTG